jgi:hypothetical protein
MEVVCLALPVLIFRIYQFCKILNLSREVVDMEVHETKPFSISCNT